MVRAERIGPTGSESVEWKTAKKRVIALDHLLVDDVGLVEARLGRAACGVGVVDLHDERGPVAAGRVGAGQAGERATTGGATVVVGAPAVVVGGRGRRRRRRRSWWPAPPWCVVGEPPTSRRAATRGDDEAAASGDGAASSSAGASRTSSVRAPGAAAMRSSSGGWVSNSRLSRARACPRPPTRAIGCSIHRWAVACVRRVDDRRVVLQLLERRDQARRVAGQLDAGHVGQRLALAADRDLHQLGDERGEDEQDEADDGEDGVGAAVVVRSPPRPRPPPHHIMRMPMSDSRAMAPTSVTASVDTRMS